MLMVAGPNGAGKTTLTRYLAGTVDLGDYINPDDIAAWLVGTYDERVGEAQRIADLRRDGNIERGVSFTFETVMSHESKLQVIAKTNEPVGSTSLLEPPAASRLAGFPLARMNGVGNRIVVLDLRGTDEIVTAEEARAIAAQPDLAFDQLMVIHDPREPGTDGFLAIYNTDGSLSGACGNGTRCVAWFMLRGGTVDDLVLTTPNARLVCRRLAPLRFSVDMGRPSFAPAEIPTLGADPAAVPLGLEADALFGPAFALGVGNPHAVFFVPDVLSLDLQRLGAPVERAPAFPERCNVSFAQVLDRRAIRLRVWERGAGATLGCGTGACATLVAAASTGRTGRTATVELPGGTLEVAWGEDDHVVMTGPVELEFEGRLDGRLGAERVA